MPKRFSNRNTQLAVMGKALFLRCRKIGGTNDFFPKAANEKNAAALTLRFPEKILFPLRVRSAFVFSARQKIRFAADGA